MTLLNERAFEGIALEEVIALASETGHSFLFIADEFALREPEHPVLVVDIAEEPGRTFRVVPSAAWSVENNLSLANMDFDEFADALDEDGVFRGFPSA